LKIIIKEKDTSYGSLKLGFDELKRVIRKQPGLFTKLFWGAIGYGFGATLGK